MKKVLSVVVVILVMFLVVGCLGTKSAPLEERIIGEWSGAQTTTSGDKVPAVWTFLEDGTMLVAVGPFAYGAKWSVDGDRLNIVTELSPERPTYRDVEFLSDNVVRLTKEEVVETWTRQP